MKHLRTPPSPIRVFRVGVLVFPALANPNPDAIALYNTAWRVLEKWKKPFVKAHGKEEPEALVETILHAAAD